MERKLVTIMLIVLIVLLLICGTMLYKRLSLDAPQGTSTPAEETADPTDEPSVPSELPKIEENAPAPEETSDQSEEEDSSLDPALDFSFTDREGNTCKLSDYHGKPIIINFWATWCPPCRAELPYLDAAFAQYGDQIQFFLMDLVDGYTETEEFTQDFVEQNGYSFPLYFDSKAEGVAAYGITAIPYTVAIGSDGKIVATHLGSMTEDDLQSIIDAVLK